MTLSNRWRTEFWNAKANARMTEDTTVHVERRSTCAAHRICGVAQGRRAAGLHEAAAATPGRSSRRAARHSCSVLEFTEQEAAGATAAAVLRARPRGGRAAAGRGGGAGGRARCRWRARRSS